MAKIVLFLFSYVISEFPIFDRFEDWFITTVKYYFYSNWTEIRQSEFLNSNKKYLKCYNPFTINIFAINGKKGHIKPI